MYLVIDPNQFDSEHVFFCDVINNSVINNAYFSKIIYSNSDVIITGVYIKLNLDFELNTDNKTKKVRCDFDINKSEKIIKKIQSIENKILSKFSNSNEKQTKIYDTMKNGFVYTDLLRQNSNPTMLILKISGVWSNKTHCGITHKFFC